MRDGASRRGWPGGSAAWVVRWLGGVGGPVAWRRGWPGGLAAWVGRWLGVLAAALQGGHPARSEAQSQDPLRRACPSANVDPATSRRMTGDARRRFAAWVARWLGGVGGPVAWRRGWPGGLAAWVARWLGGVGGPVAWRPRGRTSRRSSCAQRSAVAGSTSASMP